MDFQALKDEALLYCQASENSIQFSETKAEKLHFVCSPRKLTFYICPPTSTTESWNIWSDDSVYQEIIGSILDLSDMESCKNIKEILQHVDRFLSKAKNLNLADEHEHDASSGGEDDDDDGSDDDEDGYYVDEDIDALNDERDENIGKPGNDKVTEVTLPPSQATAANSMTIKRLVKDLQVIQTESYKFGIIGGPIDDNIFHWNVKLTDIPTDTELGKSLKKYAHKYHEEEAILLELRFKSDYPFSPPFIRVLKPRLKLFTGHVTAGGSICMQALTRSGWRPTNDIESILVQVRSEILSDPKTTLHPYQPSSSYQYQEALQAFDRMVAKYKWQ